MLPECSLSLILLVDVSGSVNDLRFNLQKEGIVNALKDPAVHRAIWQQRGIAVTIIEWETNSATVVPWQILTNPQEAIAFAHYYQTSTRSGQGVTNMGQALGAALDALPSSPCQGVREVIDISGDGKADDPTLLSMQLQRAESLNVTINGLPILGEEGLAEFYSTVILNGFMLAASSFEDFARAIRQKLAQEISHDTRTQGRGY